MTTSIITLFSYRNIEAEKDLFELNEVNAVGAKNSVIISKFDEVIADLLYLSKNSEFLETIEDPSEYNLDKLTSDWVLFIDKKGIYDQLRWLDFSGMEVARVNYNNGEPEVVAKDQLQSKAKRYYFEDTLKLEKDQIFISPFDLNIERGEVERPLKPMMRFGVPVFGDNGDKKGIVIINYLGDDLIDEFRESDISSPGGLILLNIDSYWLIGPTPDHEWGFMFEDKEDIRFNDDYPDEWDEITEKDSGQFQTDNGLFTFTTIYPLEEGWISSIGGDRALQPSEKYIYSKEYFWKTVSHVPSSASVFFRSGGIWTAIFTEVFSRYFIFYIVILVISWFLSDAIVRVRIRTRELAETNLRLKELDRLKSMFISSMSHELRTPLNSIIGFTGIMLQGMSGKINREQEKQLSMVKDSANHLLALITDIIDVSKIEAGQIDLYIKSFDLSGLIHEITDSFEITAEKKNLKLSLDIPKKIMVKSDRLRVKQIILNLVSNAIKFTQKGKITIKAVREKGRIKISVTDTGTGIKKEELKHLFKQFSRIYAKDIPIVEGTGLGLYLSRKLANLIGGEIKAESEFGRGSVFTLIMPYKQIGGRNEKSSGN